VALVSALVAIVCGIRSAFHWHDDRIRFAFYAQSLQCERNLFEVGAGEYSGDPEEALRQFVKRAEAIRMADVTEWRDLERTLGKPSDQTGRAVQDKVPADGTVPPQP
jgi:hypothetical protein